jgi:hypothetical protein
MTGIIPCNPHAVLNTPHRLTVTSDPSGATTNRAIALPLSRTPCSKCQLAQETSGALNFVKTAAEGEIRHLILTVFHAVECSLTRTDIVTTEM